MIFRQDNLHIYNRYTLVLQTQSKYRFFLPDERPLILEAYASLIPSTEVTCDKILVP